MNKRLFEYLVYVVIIVTSIGISILPDIQRIKQTPPQATFPLIHNHHNDYFSYLGYMRSGLDGDWLTTVRISAAHYQPQPIYTFFVALGHLSRILGISLPWMYFSARILFGALLLFSCVLFVRQVFTSSADRMTAVFFVAFSTGFWQMVHSQGAWTVHQFLTFWTRFDPVMRTTFLPHHTAATMLIILSLILLHKSIRTHRIKYAVLAGLLGFTAGITYHGAVTNTIGAFGVFFGILGIGFIVNTLWGKSVFPAMLFSRQRFLSLVGPFVLFGSISTLSLLYIYYLSKTTWPWTISNNLANEFTFSLPISEYLLMLGPTMLLTIIGTQKLLTATSYLPLLLLGWAVFPFIGIYFLTSFFPKYGNMIFMEAASYIPLGILAVYGLQQIDTWTGKYGRAISLVIIVVLGLYFIPPHADSVERESGKFSAALYNFYIPDPVMEGFAWLDKNTPKGATVLSGGLFGSIIPAFTHNYVVFGDDTKTYQMEKEHADMLTFFSQSDPAKGREVLDRYNVAYVFYAFDTDPPNPAYIANLPLTQVFFKDRVVIYKVQ